MFYIKKIVFCFFIICLVNVLFADTTLAIYIPQSKEIINQNIFPGKWNMKTIVTDSKCPYVLIGSTTESHLEIKSYNNATANMYSGLWKGGKWESSKSVIKLLNEKEAITERSTEMKTNDNTHWRAILIDHLYFDENDIIHSESIVTQYKNGIPVGKYKTFSILTKAE